MSEFYDIAVVGAGPAGLSAATLTAQSGLKTIVFEEHPVIGVPVQCGEGVSRYLLEHNNIDHRNGKADWIKIHLPNQNFYFPGTKKEHGYDEFGVYRMGNSFDSFLVNRTKFDQMLAAKAEDAGAEIRTGTKVIKLSIDVTNGAELTTKSLTKGSSVIHAKMVVACDGPASRMAASQGLKAPLNYVHAAEWKIKGQLSETLDFYFDHELTPEGYSWVFPKHETSTIGLTCRKVQNPAQRLNKLMKMMEKRFNKTFEKIELIGGLIPANPTQPCQTHKDRFILAGDAGGFTNPIFYGGIAIAILTGRMAGESIVEAVEMDPDHHFSEKNLARYDTKWQNAPQFDPVIYKGRKLFYKNFTNVELEQMGKLTNNVQVGQINWLKAKYLITKAFFTGSIRVRWKDYKTVFEAFSLSGKWGF